MGRVDPESALPVASGQSVVGLDQSQQAILGSGVQNIYFGPQERREAAASLAVPLGRREDRFPLRGRDELLETLLAAEPEAQVNVLCGLGGCGKTSVALEVAARLSGARVETWWVAANDAGEFGRAMQALARRVGLSAEQACRGDVVDLVWQRLTDRRERWLLVFDNADDLGVLEHAGARLSDGTGWLRPLASSAGQVLVTSRHGRAAEWGAWCRLHRVGVLPAAAAGMVLIDHAGVGAGSVAEAEALAVRLGGLPLALQIAGRSLAEGRSVPEAFAGHGTLRNFAQYRAVLEEGQHALTFPSPEEDVSTVVGRTWGLSLELLERRGDGDARVLLALLACLADAPIPHELLLDPGTLAGSPLFPSISGRHVWRSLQALESVGLINLPGPTAGDTTAGEPGVLRMHSLVRDASQPRDGASDGVHYLALAAALLKRAAVEIGQPEDTALWGLWRLLAPHAFHVLNTVRNTDEALEAVENAAYAASLAARYQGATGAYAQSETSQRKVLAARERVLGADHPDTLASRHSTAWTMGKQGRYAEAETEYRAVLTAREWVLGTEHPNTLDTRHQIARMVGGQGRYAEAEIEFRAVLAARTRVLGADDSNTLATRHSIAVAMGGQGRYPEAETEWRAVLAARTRVLGPEHPNTLTTRLQIARLMAGQGRYADAETELRAVLTACERVLGAEHPNTLTIRHEIAQTMAAQGRYADADAEFRAVLTARERVLGDDHPYTQRTRGQLEQLRERRTEPR